jgi:hypothetical protein
MIIERFFGKGRTDQSDSRAQQNQTPVPAQTPVPPQAQKKSQAKKADEPKPQRAEAKRAGAETLPRPSEPGAAPAAKARSGRAAVAVPTSDASGTGTLAPPSYEEIAARAYDLWMAQGRPEGRDHENWTEAERQLRAERARG